MQEQLIPGRKAPPPGGPKVGKAPIHDPVRRRLSDAELLAKYEQGEEGKFAIPPGIVPVGMAYEWKAETVMGKPNITGMSRYQQRGWQFVPAERHPGLWTEPGSKGAIRLEGQVLMEIDAETYADLTRVDLLRARGAVRDLCAQLGSAPPGTGPREHERVRPSVTRTYEPLPIE